MEILSVVQSLLIALWVAAVMSRWLGGGATLTLRFSPLMTGLVVGLIMGEVAQALEGTVVIHILEVVGGGLAAIGIATAVYVIGRKDYLVFFFLAYFMSVVLKSLDITMVTYAIFGIIIALIFVQSQKGKQVQPATSNNNSASFDDEDDYDDGF